MNRQALPSGAVWWIFRKDLALLWPLAALSIGLIGLCATPLFQDVSGGRSVPRVVTAFACLIPWILLVTLIVQQDPTPGSDQDWLVRPVRRADVLAAKVLGVIAMIHVPLFLGVVTRDFAEGFRLAQAVPAALLINLQAACGITLPVMAVAATSRSVAEALITALVAAAGAAIAVLLYVGSFLVPFHTEPALGACPGVQWVWILATALLTILTGAMTILLAYLWRRVRAAKIVFCLGMALAVTVFLFPWRLAYAIGEWLAPAGPVPAVAISFAPDTAATFARRTPPWTSLLLRDDPQNRFSYPVPLLENMKQTDVSSKEVRIALPFKVTGLPAGTILHGDAVAVRIKGQRRVVYRGMGWSFDVPAHAADGTELLGEAIDIPTDIYERLAHRTASVRIEFALTLMRRRSFALAIPSTALLPRLGRCTVRNQGGSAGPSLSVASLSVECMAVGRKPCVTVQFDPFSGNRTGIEAVSCPLDYAPSLLSRLGLEPLNRFALQIPPSVATYGGSTLFSVSPAAVTPSSAITLSEFWPVAHFVRSLAVKDVDLSAWRYRPKVSPPAANAPVSVAMGTLVRPRGTLRRAAPREVGVQHFEVLQIRDGSHVRGSGEMHDARTRLGEGGPAGQAGTVGITRLREVRPVCCHVVGQQTVGGAPVQRG